MTAAPAPIPRRRPRRLIVAGMIPSVRSMPPDRTVSSLIRNRSPREVISQRPGPACGDRAQFQSLSAGRAWRPGDARWPRRSLPDVPFPSPRRLRPQSLRHPRSASNLRSAEGLHCGMETLLVCAWRTAMRNAEISCSLLPDPIRFQPSTAPPSRVVLGENLDAADTTVNNLATQDCFVGTRTLATLADSARHGPQRNIVLTFSLALNW